MVSLTSLSTELDWLLRILVAALCGTAIGYELGFPLMVPVQS